MKRRTTEELLSSLTDEQKAGILSDLDCDMSVCFELLDLELAEYETNSDDDMFWWLTDLGKDVLMLLEEQAMIDTAIKGE